MSEGERDEEGRGSGLRASERGALPRDAGRELPRGRGALLAAHRERRIRLASVLLAVSLLLGVSYLAVFVNLGFLTGPVPTDFHGQVLDAARDEPVAGALVEIRALNVTTVTDAGGNFTIAGVPSGRTEVRISKENYQNTTFVIFLAPLGATAVSPGVRGIFQISQGTGEAVVDTTGDRAAYLSFCLILHVTGNILTAAGFLATLSRRRYSHVMLGGVGAVLAIGFYVGALLGVLAVYLVRGSRGEFADGRALFGPSEVPPLVPGGDEGGTEDEEEPAPVKGGPAEKESEERPPEASPDEGNSQEVPR